MILLGKSNSFAESFFQETDGGFAVPAGDLAFSVTVFTICAISTIALLMVRRMVGVFGKAELGGPVGPKYATSAFLIGLWFLYVTLSSLKAYGLIFSSSEN